MASRNTLFNKLSGSYWNAGVTFERTNPVPLEKYSVFQTKADADAYALTNVVSYPGQTVAVVGETETKLYYINTTSTLVELGSAAGAESGVTGLSNQIFGEGALSSKLFDKIVKDVGDLSTALSNDVTADVADLNKNLSIDVTVEAGTGDVLSSYIISQGGIDKTVKIDIPKDKVITAAAVIEFTSDEAAVEATGDENAKAGHYLQLSIQNQEKDLYVPVPALASSYSGHDGDTIKLDVVNPENDETFTISATVKTGSIGAEHLTTALSTEIQTVVDREAADRTAIETLSGEGEGSVKKAKADVEAELQALSTSLSTETKNLISAEVTARDTADKSLSNDYTAKIGALSTSLSNTVDAISGSLYDKVEAEATARNAAVEALSTSLSNTADAKFALSADVTAISGSLFDKIDTDVATKSSVYVGSGTDEAKLGDIKIQKVTSEEYAAVLKAGDIPTSALYVIENPNGQVDAFGQKVVHVAAGELSDDAVNVHQLSTVSSDLNTAIKNAVTNGIDELSTKVFVGETSLSAKLQKAVDDETTNRTTAVGNLSTSLSNTVDAISGSLYDKITTDVGNELTARNKAIKDVSVALSTDYSEKVGAVASDLSNNYVKKTYVLDGTTISESNRLWLGTKISAFVESKINGLDVDEVTTTQAETISAISEVDGKISVRKGKIQISKDQVTDLNTQLTAIENDVNTFRGVSSTYETHAEHEAFENDTGLSAASPTNMVVTKQDIADLAGAMHFVGVAEKTTELSTDALAIAAKVTNPKAGDIVIVGVKEYVYAASEWHELGDEGIYLTTAAFEAWKSETYATKMSAVDLSVENLSSYAAGLSTYAKGLSDDLATEIQARRDNDTYLSGQISGNLTAFNTWKASAELSIGGLSADLATEIQARAANDTYLSGVIENTVSADLYTLSNEVSAISSEINSTIAAEVTRAEEAETEISNSLSDYVKIIKINGTAFEYDSATNTASIEISAITCGSAA